MSAYSERTIVSDGIVEGADTEGEERQRTLVHLVFVIAATLTSVQRLMYLDAFTAVTLFQTKIRYIPCILFGTASYTLSYKAKK